MQIIFLFANSSMPKLESSRPNPERLMPPKGNSGVVNAEKLRNTIPD